MNKPVFNSQSISALNDLLINFRVINNEVDLINEYKKFVAENFPFEKVAIILLQPIEKLPFTYPIVNEFPNSEFNESPDVFFQNHVIQSNENGKNIHIINLQPYRLTKGAFAVLPTAEGEENIEFFRNLLSVAGNIFFRRWLDIRSNFDIYPYEGHFNMIVENMNEGIMLVSNNDEIIYANKRFCAMTENTPEEILTHTASDLFLDSEGKKVIAEKIQARQAGNIDSYELHAKTKSGKDVYMFIHGMPLRDEAGVVIGSIGVHTDVTDFRNKEFQLQQSLREKEILLREIHHRVKNNLALISGLLELQLMNDGEKKGSEGLRMSVNRIHSIALIHDQLYINEHLDKIGMNDYVLNLITHIQNSMTNKKGNVQFHVHASDCALSINQAVPFGILITEVVMNSLKYAFKHTDSGEITIDFKHDENEILLTLSDNGVGLPQEKDKRKNSFGTTIINSMVRQLFGKLEITSDQGVKYFVRFPIEKK